MSTQDRTYTRTAADFERKYNLGHLAQGVPEKNPDSEQVSKIAQELSEYKTAVNRKLQSIETSINEIEGVIGSGGTGDFNQEVTQAELDVVSALANANKAAHEANASAIKVVQGVVEKVSGRITTIEDWKGEITEATSSDINGLFEIGE